MGAHNRLDLQLTQLLSATLAGSFYNKAPRFSVIQGDSYTCERLK